MSEPKTTPTIIKRKKVVSGGGHHGGAWKVAYADFVTAMMAFFMLMWLLNATTEKQRKGIADYFSPDIPVSRASAGWNAPTEVVHQLGYDYPVFRRTRGWQESERSPRISC